MAKDIITLKHLMEWVEDWRKNCELNGIEPKDVPVTVENRTTTREYEPFCGTLSFGSDSIGVKIGYFESDIVRFDPADVRPEEGEYWQSRGVTDGLDVAGFVKSRPAGMRLLRLVRYLLEDDNPRSWLDYREFEPNYIQFKFDYREFDVKALDEKSRKNGGILTEQILKDCLRTNIIKNNSNE